ncbi:MAG: hypothetical protein WCK90_00400 [archaeon]
MKNKRGQVAIFIIIAIVLVILIVGIFLYQREIISFGGKAFSPESYLKDCITPEIQSDIAILAKQGGYASPTGFVTYKDEKIAYLCYISEFYKPCVVQEPFVRSNFENELSKLITNKVSACVDNLKREYERKGYSVSSAGVVSSVSIAPKKLNIDIKAPMTITKDTSQTFKQFNVQMDSQIYTVLAIAESIVNFEAVYGDSETTVYMQFYPNIMIEKNKLSDGTKIYKISDVVTKESFTFASRGLSWPPGYQLR